MNHSVEELIKIAHRYYPRAELVDVPGLGRVTDLVHPPPSRPLDGPHNTWPPAGYDQTEEHRRVAALRVEAGKKRGIWREVIEQIQAQLPERSVSDDSLNLLSPAGNGDSGNAGSIPLPPRSLNEESHQLKFMVSFLVPYYIMWASSWTRAQEADGAPAAEPPEALSPAQQAVLNAAHASRRDGDPPDGQWVLYLPSSSPPEARREFPTYEYSFDLSADEQPDAQVITEIIKAAFPGHERMPPEIGQIVVPDVVVDLRGFGQATLYDCFFTRGW